MASFLPYTTLLLGKDVVLLIQVFISICTQQTFNWSICCRLSFKLWMDW